MATDCVVIVQARMGSQRLPGKVLAPLHGDHTILGLLLTRFNAWRDVCGPIVVATTREAADDAVAAEAERYEAGVIRGDRDDVLSRFIAAIDEYRPELVIRATADDPFMAPEVAAQLLELIRADGSDHAFAPGLPRGASPEIVRAAALKRLAAAGPTADEREHVTTGIRERAGFRRSLLSLTIPATDLDLSVDTAADLERVRSLAARVIPVHGPVATLEQIISSAR